MTWKAWHGLLADTALTHKICPNIHPETQFAPTAHFHDFPQVYSTDLLPTDHELDLWTLRHEAKPWSRTIKNDELRFQEHIAKDREGKIIVALMASIAN